jgi:hypothetical protein
VLNYTGGSSDDSLGQNAPPFVEIEGLQNYISEMIEKDTCICLKEH